MTSLERESERLRALERLGVKPEPDPGFDRFARITRRQLGVPIALVSLLEADRQIFPGLDGLGGWAGESRQTPLSHSFCRHVVEQQWPMVFPDAREDPAVCDNPAIRDLGVVAYAGMPLTDSAGLVLGSLCAIDTRPRAWSGEDLEALRDLADACSSELRSRELLQAAEVAQRQAETAQRQAEADRGRLSILSEVSRALTVGADHAETWALLSPLIVPAVADWAMVLLADHGELSSGGLGTHRDPARSADLERLAELQSHLVSEAAIIPRVARTGEPVIVPVVGSDILGRGASSAETVQVIQRLGLGSLIVVPLVGRTNVVGVLLLAREVGSEAFIDQDLALALEIGRRAGAAQEAARLLRDQRRTSEVLQRSLLTRLPQPDHLHLVARYQPAAHEVEVGGDWYDAFLQPDGATVLVIGDVVGHDMAAAAAMGQLRNLLRGTAYDSGDPPVEVVTRVDTTIAGLEVNTLASVIVARIEQTPRDEAAGNRRLRWSNAGHPPPMVVHADGSVDVLDQPADLLLGVDATLPRTEHTTVLPVGSLLFLYTDGLVERRGGTLDEGLEKLREALSRTVDLGPDAVCDHVLEALLPGDGEDDVAILAVRAGRG